MNMKQIIFVAKMCVITPRTCVVCPLRKCVANLHDNSKSNMAAIVNKVYWYAGCVRDRIRFLSIGLELARSVG